ncbi:MAG TPA: hypothetical protein VMS40_23980 [Vicinamibacterales bacterium]|nr:hypothetical protein [Vicinamibacterales bacterium]
MTAKLVKSVALLTLAALAASCGEFTREGRSPAIVIVRSLLVARGDTPDELSGNLLSDVRVLRTSPAPCSDAAPCPTIFNDVAEVQLSLILKDPGAPGIGANPSTLNQVTINHYRVEFRRADGRNTPGVDVPFPFESAMTFTVLSDGVSSMGFEIVRHVAKEEAPLKALAVNGNIISTIARVTFYGRDQAGNEISATADVGVDFGDFADPA